MCQTSISRREKPHIWEAGDRGNLSQRYPEPFHFEKDRHHVFGFEFPFRFSQALSSRRVELDSVGNP